MFKIIVLGGPCELYIKKCIDSILSQDEQDFEILVALDAIDSAIWVVNEFNDPRIKVLSSSELNGGLCNMKSIIDRTEVDDEDILAFVDADDWLTDSNSLSVVKKVYDDHPDTLVTHGSWKSSPPGFMGKDCLRPYTREDFKDIRHAPWKGTHLKTLKYKVFKLIKEADMKNDDGVWLRGAGDLVMMIPALEMAGFDRVKFIQKPIYTYSIGGPRSSVTHCAKMQESIRLCRSRKPYERLGV